MRTLSVFNQISLDGYIADKNGDMSWAHKEDPEWNAFTSENASGGAELVFGRITYDMMAGFWPTPLAHERAPAVAEAMNNLPKIVFSRTLGKATWMNTRLVSGDLATEVRRLKEERGPGLVILGSGSIVAQLTEARLIDEYQVALCPVVLGAGKTMFEGVKAPVPLELKRSRVFGNGSVVLWYELRA